MDMWDIAGIIIYGVICPIVGIVVVTGQCGKSLRF